jgi:magnesium chelatase subunit I
MTPAAPSTIPPRTLVELRASGYRPRSVKEELRANLIEPHRGRRARLDGIVGFEETVVPAVENAILAARTSCSSASVARRRRAWRARWSALLDAEIPVVGGGSSTTIPWHRSAQVPASAVASHG